MSRAVDGELLAERTATSSRTSTCTASTPVAQAGPDDLRAFLAALRDQT